MLVPADSQQTTSGLPAVSKWTPSGLQGFNVESSFGELFWETIYELPVDSHRTPSGQAPYRLLYLETSFGDLIWRPHLESSFGETIGLPADSQHSVESKQALGSKNVIFSNLQIFVS